MLIDRDEIYTPVIQYLYYKRDGWSIKMVILAWCGNWVMGTKEQTPPFPQWISQERVAPLILIRNLTGKWRPWESDPPASTPPAPLRKWASKSAGSPSPDLVRCCFPLRLSPLPFHLSPFTSPSYLYNSSLIPALWGQSAVRFMIGASGHYFIVLINHIWWKLAKMNLPMLHWPFSKLAPKI